MPGLLSSPGLRASRAPACCNHHPFSSTQPGYWSPFSAPLLQGFATAGSRQRPTMQRIVVANRSAAQEREPLHNSFSHGDYVPGSPTPRAS
jgi:hypothetical protein